MSRAHSAYRLAGCRRVAPTAALEFEGKLVATRAVCREFRLRLVPVVADAFWPPTRIGFSEFAPEYWV
jgi:hypothetical protein